MIEVWDSLYDAFASIPDPRVERTKRHSLIDIISIAICAVICGADSWVAVATFGKAKQAWLEHYLALPNGIPSHDTFGRLFAALDASAFQLQVAQLWQQADLLITGNLLAAELLVQRGDGEAAEQALRQAETLTQQERFTAHMSWVAVTRASL